MIYLLKSLIHFKPHATPDIHVYTLLSYVRLILWELERHMYFIYVLIKWGTSRHQMQKLSVAILKYCNLLKTLYLIYTGRLWWSKIFSLFQFFGYYHAISVWTKSTALLTFWPIQGLGKADAEGGLEKTETWTMVCSLSVLKLCKNIQENFDAENTLPELKRSGLNEIVD